MHEAPSVTYPVGRARFAGLLGSGLGLAAMVLAGYWLHQSDSSGWRQALAALAALVAGTAAVLSWQRAPVGVLVWDGAGWSAPGSGETGSLAVALDLQHLLLVRWRGPTSSRWLWLERHRSPHSWADLRRAVYSRARPSALPAARPPSATP